MHRPVRPIRDILDATPHALLGWSEIPAPMVVGLMARSGFDVILLDQQHGQHDTASCIAAIAEAALAGVPAIVRLRVGDNAEAARMLDLGAAGVVAPMIESAAEARASCTAVTARITAGSTRRRTAIQIAPTMTPAPTSSSSACTWSPPRSCSACV